MEEAPCDPANQGCAGRRSLGHAPAKIGGNACSWLIRHLVDLRAVILFVAATEEEGRGGALQRAPLSTMRGVFSHRGELRSFEVMLMEIGLSIDDPASEVVGPARLMGDHD